MSAELAAVPYLTGMRATLSEADKHDPAFALSTAVK